MKKLIAAMMTMILMLSAAALAESDYTYFPESEEYVGTWYVDDYIMEIAHMENEANLFRCVVTQYAEDREGVRWTYEGCSYDDVGKALASLEIGVKINVVFDEDYEIAASEPVFDDGAAAFKLNEDGTLTWTDFKEAPGEDELVFKKVMIDDENPIAAFEGRWISGRATLTIEELDDVVYCTIHWAGSAFDAAEWSYEGCLYDEISGGLTTFEIGVKTINVYDESGEVVSSEQVFDDGAAAFKLNEDGTLTWTDFKETPGENELVFKRLPD